MATAAAIGRTLKGAGLDWHDLAQRVARPAQEPHPAPRTASPSPESPTWSAETAAAYQAAQAAKRQPSPWPTWGRLSHFGRLGMLDTIVAEAAFTPAEAETMTAFRTAYYRHQVTPGGKLIRLFNAACRNLWERGWRPEVAA